jgi:hypothetical protein
MGRDIAVAARPSASGNRGKRSSAIAVGAAMMAIAGAADDEVR